MKQSCMIGKSDCGEWFSKIINKLKANSTENEERSGLHYQLAWTYRGSSEKYCFGWDWLSNPLRRQASLNP